METANKTMRNFIITVLVVLFFTVIIGGLLINRNNSAIDKLTSDNEQLELGVQERDSLVNEFITAFDSIESSLTFINEKQNQLSLAGNEMTVSQKDAIIEDIKLMNTMLEESSVKIEELEQKLKKSGIQLKSFKNKIAGLSKKIEHQNSQIDELKLQYKEQNKQLAVVSYEKDSLQNEVLSILDSVQLKEELIAEREEVISQQIGELNKAFFAYGTAKELTENNVIAKEGGFLGVGRNKMVPNNFNEDYFTRIDITEQHSIELNAKKVNLISEHPTSSYKLIEEDGLITRLEIEAPVDFWKISQYAVIEIKL